jgi:hypothetical protein
MSTGRHRAVGSGSHKSWWILLLVVGMVGMGTVAVAEMTDPPPEVF